MDEFREKSENIKLLLKQVGYKTLRESILARRDLIVKEAEGKEGNKDYLTGILKGIRICLEMPDSIIKSGEINKGE